MVKTRAQKRKPASTPEAQGEQYGVTESLPESTRPSRDHVGGQPEPPEHTPRPVLKGSVQQEANHSLLVRSSVTKPPQPPDADHGRARKRVLIAAGASDDSPRKRQQASPKPPKNTPSQEAVGGNEHSSKPVGFWIREDRWPREYFQREAKAVALVERETSQSIGNNTSDMTGSPSGKSRDAKSAPYRSPRYPLILEGRGSFMRRSKLGIVDASTLLCGKLLGGEQAVPKDTIFDDDVFSIAFENMEGKNEARVIQDLSRLLVPSAETLALRNAKLGDLAESVDTCWSSSIPLAGARPQPDYAVGFKREAFSQHQLDKLSPFIGDCGSCVLSLFMGTYFMHFPFLTCETKCGSGGLEIANRQNAHSMTLAVRGIVELFRLVQRETEVHRQILAFAISHDDQSVRIYGHYAEINGQETKYYRLLIRSFSLVDMGGKERWTAYRFTKNVYELWAPGHLKKIRSAVDQLPSTVNLDVPSPSEGDGPSQVSEKLSHPEASSASVPAKKDHRRQGVPGQGAKMGDRAKK